MYLDADRKVGESFLRGLKLGGGASIVSGLESGGGKHYKWTGKGKVQERAGKWRANLSKTTSKI